ncbi:DNA repair exonuclease [Rhodobacteraceae bacterium M382]|nr:DNA repair exonuclease [Rhodobacteraceae bacterium M382]
MTEFRLIHTSDLHLGKGFGTLPDSLRGRLIEARHEVIGRLADAARTHRAAHVLVAGDMFDTIGPSPEVRRQAATAMSAAQDIQWWIIPGNHDSLRAEELWRAFDQETGENVHLLRDPSPVEMAQGVQLLPAPLPRQFPGSDLTGWMVGAETPPDALRIGLAHGGVVSFGENFDGSAVIAPDRAETAGLDYLAMGDWHGQLRVTDRTWYCGTPERDRFKHDGRGVCLAVTLNGPGAVPDVTPVDVGRFEWRAPDLRLSPGMDIAAECARILTADRAARRDILLQVRVSGFLRMAERGQLDEEIAKARPDYAHLGLRDGDLSTEYETEDLDLIATGGALRAAAEELHLEAQGQGGSSDDMRVAQAALNRLWSLVREG